MKKLDIREWRQSLGRRAHCEKPTIRLKKYTQHGIRVYFVKRKAHSAILYWYALPNTILYQWKTLDFRSMKRIFSFRWILYFVIENNLNCFSFKFKSKLNDAKLDNREKLILSLIPKNRSPITWLTFLMARQFGVRIRRLLPLIRIWVIPPYISSFSLIQFFTVMTPHFFRISPKLMSPYSSCVSFCTPGNSERE
jgi:hypothetical protein